MKIGIIIYSQTGNTSAVAEKIKIRLIERGHAAEIERIEIEGEMKQGMEDIVFKSVPETDKYDIIVFGSPVQSFSLNPVMKNYLDQLHSLGGKKIACFVTKGLPGRFTGGNQAIRTMLAVCEEKGGTVEETGVVVWSGSREKTINDIAEKICKSLQQ
ncbi:flavodoxin family protein [Anoxynatronum sibiricum]|uniref:NAD(P)H-dependent oxidoreductase n=1 Tax=Anoxynatronum sibiricum TaxID=210623 RepID=A0ABU9VTB4_9CLOT